jgi:hypothetical protein
MLHPEYYKKYTSVVLGDNDGNYSIPRRRMKEARRFRKVGQKKGKLKLS